MPPRVLLTGAAGLIGSHVADHILTTTDWEIVALDKLTYAGRLDRLHDSERWAEASTMGRARVLFHDLRAPIPTWLDAEIGEVDHVLNLASFSHVDRSIADPREAIENNVALALNMLEWARTRSLTSFTQFSSDEVYGPRTEPATEWDTIAPSSPYSASKACQDSLAIAWYRTYGVPVTLVASMNVYGNRAHPEKMVGKAQRLLGAGLPVPVHGEFHDGEFQSGSRAWIHARNVADALLHILGLPREQGPLPPRYNIVGEVLLNTEVVSVIAEAMQVPYAVQEIAFDADRPGHDLHYSLDGSKLAATGWTAPVGVREAMRQTVLWTQKNQKWLVP